MKFKLVPTEISGLSVIEPKIFADERGFFTESYNKRAFNEIGINSVFVQDNHSFSKKGVLRGLHFQTKHPQAKLVRVIRGEVYDVAVDLRKGLDTFGKYFGLVISSTNKRMLFIPEGFAHGFLVLSDTADFMYKVSDFYYPEYDSGVVWNDEDIGIQWPLGEYDIEQPILSQKDRDLSTLRDVRDSLA